MTEQDETALLCNQRVEGFNGEMRDCNGNLFEIIMVEQDIIKLRCIKCGFGQTFRVSECLDLPSA
jgi:hypothetical protein